MKKFFSILILKVCLFVIGIPNFVMAVEKNSDICVDSMRARHLWVNDILDPGSPNAQDSAWLKAKSQDYFRETVSKEPLDFGNGPWAKGLIALTEAQEMALSETVTYFFHS